jgi:type VI secretion system secreted protein VgrG
MALSSNAETLPFELLFPETGASLRVTAFTGREHVSRPFRLHVTATAPGGDIAFARSLLGARATLVIHQAESIARRIHGAVARASFGAVLEGGERVLELTILPRLYRLCRRRARRIFQDLTTIGIAEAILGEHGLPLRSFVFRDLLRRAYCVQYDETDLEFLTRLFAEDGIFYSFEHAEAATEGDILVLADRPSDAPPIDGDPRLVLYRGAGGAGSVIPENGVLSLSPHVRALSRRARVRGYDFRRPRTTLDDEAAVDPASVETMDEHEGSYEDDLTLRPAGIRLEQERARSVEVRAETYCKRLAPMRRFALDDEGAFGLAGEFIVTRVDHEGYGGDAVPAGRARYQNRVRFVPAEVAPRPRWSLPKPRQVAEVATVVGPPGAEIHTDEHGRIKVQFHWDREGRGDDKSTCWLRVAQAWAGAGWGSLFIPRVGMEVVVTFLGGDVDRPLVTGCVYNATHPPPFPLPEHQSRSGIRTSSTPGGHGFNEISFNDHAGDEQLFVRAQRDYDEVVGQNRTTRITGSRLDEVSGSATTRVSGAASVTIGAERKIDVGGAEVTRISGGRSSTVAEDDSLDVAGGSRTRIGGDATVEVRGRSTFLVGTDEDPSHREELVFGTATFASKEQLVVRSETSVLLHCGSASIELTRDKILFHAPTIELEATESLQCKAKNGPTVTLSEDVELLSKKVRIFSEGAALELDRDAKLNGDKIRLGYDPSKPQRKEDEEAPKTRTFKCRLTDYYLEPYARRKYHLLAGGLRFEGETGGDGLIEVEIPAPSRSVTVRLWLDDFPEGRQRLFSFRLGDLPPVTDIRGAKTRLRNLGYYAGPLNAELSDEFKTAVVDFQEDHRSTHDLEPTGELDEGTVGALEEAHGH